MKKHYTLFKMAIAFLLTIAGLYNFAQNVKTLSANNVSAGLSTGGNLFSNDSVNRQLYESPKGSGIKTMYTAALWIAGLDNSNNAHVAAQRYKETGRDFFDGPIAAAYDSVYDRFYKRVFKITRAQITHHISLGHSINQSQIDSDILFWPAKGNAFISTAYNVTIGNHLAPFVDVDGDHVYNPATGDYPATCGEEAVFFVLNDDRGPHGESGGAKLGIEIRGLAEVFLDSSFGGFNAPLPQKRAINNTVFVSYEIENKSLNDYHDFYVGLFEDVDLGCFANDRIGCDTNRSLMFVYNDSPDFPCNGLVGFENTAAAFGTKKLNGKLHAFGYFLNGSTAATTDPLVASTYRNYLDGFWADGTPFTSGGTGYNGSSPTKFLFPGRPAEPNDWTDAASPLQAGDRRMFNSTKTATFAKNQIQHYDYAFTTSYDATADNLTIVDTLKRDAEAIQQFYDNTLLPCRANLIPVETGVTSLEETFQLSVYPNPSSTVLIVEAETKIDLVEVTDMLGRTALSKTCDASKVTIDVSGLAKGLYLLKVKSANNSGQLKIVKE